MKAVAKASRVKTARPRCTGQEIVDDLQAALELMRGVLEALEE